MSKQKRSELKNVEMRRWWRILSAEGQWWMGMECGRWKEALKALRGEELGPVHVETRLREIACQVVCLPPLLLLGVLERNYR